MFRFSARNLLVAVLWQCLTSTSTAFLQTGQSNFVSARSLLQSEKFSRGATCRSPSTRLPQLCLRKPAASIPQMVAHVDLSQQTGNHDVLSDMGWEILSAKVGQAKSWRWADKTVFPREGREYRVPRSRYFLADERIVSGLSVQFLDGDSCRINGRFDARYAIYRDQHQGTAGEHPLFVRFEMHGYPDMPDQPVEQILALERLFAAMLFRWCPATQGLQYHWHAPPTALAINPATPPPPQHAPRPACTVKQEWERVSAGAWRAEAGAAAAGEELHIGRFGYVLRGAGLGEGLEVALLDRDSCRLNGRFDAHYAVYRRRAAHGPARFALRFGMVGYPDMPDQPVEQIAALERLFARFLFEWSPTSSLLRHRPVRLPKLQYPLS